MPPSACILNTGQNAWAFEPIANAIASATGLPVHAQPQQKNYLLACDSLPEPSPDQDFFVPLRAIQIATDKRLIAATFAHMHVPSPQTVLVDTLTHAQTYASKHPEKRWCLKYPNSCAGTGHRLLEKITTLPADWPKPIILQEFITMHEPAVYRTYSVRGEIFGWIARRFPPGRQPSPWVAHARGARYESCGELPSLAKETAQQALSAAGLYKSFGCVDLIENDAGQWLALEVGTDGWTSHVDRDLADEQLEAELTNRLAAAIKAFAATT